MTIFYSDNKTVPQIFEEKKFSGINGLRAVSIIIVLLGHLNKHYIHIDWLNLTIQEGGLGVNFFFVISGFLITTLLLKENVVKGEINIKNFYIRRIFRIFPVAYLYLLVVFCLNYFFDLNITYSYFLIAALYLVNIGGIVGNRNEGNGVLIGHYWSLSAEEQYYVIYPLFFKYLRKFLPLLMIIALVLINVVILSTSHVYFFYYFQGILIGAIYSFFLFSSQIRKRIVPYSAFLQLTILLAILIVSYSQIKLSMLLTSTLIALFITLMIIDESKNIFYKILNNRVMEFIGILSYSIYIWQQGLTLPSGLNSHIQITNDPFISIAILCFISFISYTYFESYFLRIKERFK